MPMPSQDKIIAVCQEICTVQELKVTVSESAKGALAVGACAFGGGMLGGPVGMGIGGVIGSILAAMNGQGKFRSVVEVLNDMTPEQKAKLAIALQDIFNDIEIQDVVITATFIMSRGSLQAALMEQLRNYLKNEMGLRLL